MPAYTMYAQIMTPVRPCGATTAMSSPAWRHTGVQPAFTRRYPEWNKHRASGAHLASFAVDCNHVFWVRCQPRVLHTTREAPISKRSTTTA
jgi:hypothetical protein